MANQSYSNDEHKWIEDRIASLSPPTGFRPSVERAIERIMQQEKSASNTRGLRLGMAVVTLAAIALVLTLLPWQMLWTPKTGKNTVSAQQAVTIPVPEPTEPSKAEPSTKDEPQPEPTQNPEDELKKFFNEGFTKKRALDGKLQTPVVTEVQTIQQAGAAQTVAVTQQQTPQPDPPSRVSEPVLISQVQPVYTMEAKEAKVQGTIEVRVTVHEDGTVTVDNIAKGLGYGLDEAAAAAVAQWKFRPGMKDGKPVPVMISILVNFSLR